MKYLKKQQLQYLAMLGKVGEDWQIAVGGKYRSSAGWRLLTTLWRDEKIKMPEIYKALRELSSTNTQRAFVIDAIRDGLVECDDHALTQRLRNPTGSTRHNKKDRRGLTSPYVWLSDTTKKELDAFFDKAIEQLLSTADVVRSEQ
jgi:hypothetical protein